MGIYRLKPACKDYLWGGHKLVEDFGIEYEGDVCAEAWLLSCHEDGKSIVADGQYEGKSLDELIDVLGKECLGTACRDKEDFPILIKLIDSRKPLSIQVHPDEEYARTHEGQHGKTEMWYVLDADEGAYIYRGFSKSISKEEFEKRISDNTLEEVLNKEYVKRGDVFLITPGTLHALGGGILLTEIQQSSNVTYRIYDYGRVGADGKERPLHIRQALDVTELVMPHKYTQGDRCLLSCEHFVVSHEAVTSDVSFKESADERSFVSIIVIGGQGSITCCSDSFECKKGESYFITAGSGEFQIDGDAEVLITRIP
ncbi:type I phosphomannose isomerase catalytic subunit [Butyrivibrio sp. XPD2006]|uniref:type I phosphomannose isomerase catalytic subunit n=1 Tax=Butyrivibrio sp. XPD2006 TaxID=1280668 RepID=UPI0003B63854|nr:type I phosphomannose isomerase catalytic subunit [Butyrivibrio sp. XPD2006]